MNRLETLSPELSDKLQHASMAKQRAVAIAAAEFAIAHAKVEHPMVAEVLQAMRSGWKISSEQRTSMEALVSQFDDNYFQLQETVDEGRATTDDYLRVFSKARAVAALLSASKDEPIEAVYEAAVTDDKPDTLFSIVGSILK